jgi:hypothetical protein
MCVTNALLQIDQSTFSIRVLRTATAPAPRYHHSAVVFGKFMVVHGGFDASNEPLGDTWSFDFETAQWEVMPCSAQAPRAGHAAVVLGSRMLVSGGYETSLDGEGAAPVASILELSLIPTPGTTGTFAWREVPVGGAAVAPVAFHGACVCGDGASFMVFGGMTVPPPKAPKEKTTAARRPSTAGATATTPYPSRSRHSSSESSTTHPADTDMVMHINPACDQGLVLLSQPPLNAEERTTQRTSMMVTTSPTRSLVA